MTRFLLIAGLACALSAQDLAAQFSPPEVPSLPPEASEQSFARTALFASMGSFAGLFGGALIGAGTSGGEVTGAVVALTLSGSVIGSSWAGASTSGRSGPAVLGSILGSVAGVAYLVAAEPQGFGGVVTYSLIQGFTTAIATRF